MINKKHIETKGNKNGKYPKKINLNKLKKFEICLKKKTGDIA